MRSACIDIGTNSVRLLVGTRRQGEQDSLSTLIPLRKELEVTRLGAGMDRSEGSGGVLRDECISRTVEVVERFCAIARQEGADGIVLAATSAVREAANAQEFLREVLKATGLQVRVLSERQEAEVTAEGVLRESGLSVSLGDCLVLDIGGGSTEMIHLRDGVLQSDHSAAVGVVVLSDMFLQHDPPLTVEREGVVKHAALTARKLRDMIPSVGSGGMRMIGTAGTVTTLAAMDLALDLYDSERISGHVLTLKRLEEQSRRYWAMDFSSRSALPGLGVQRADLILPGIDLTIEIMRAFAVQELTVSDAGLLEGLWYRFIDDRRMSPSD